ncbi:MAG: hypothetical protein MZV65_15885 [Chromatiales bacterium]|nr:hypothetical protein [Chromatiales bacterium]
MKSKAMLIAVLIALVAVAGAWAAGVDRYDAVYASEGSSLRFFYTPTTTDQRVAANTQDGLVEQDRFGRFVPSLAESWTVSPDGLSVDLQAPAGAHVGGLRRARRPR